MIKRPLSAIRTRFTSGRVLLAVGLVVGFFGSVALLETEEAGAPPDHAARLVPSDALVYLHLTVDRDSRQWRNATRLAKRFPSLVAVRNRLLRGLTARGGALDLEREVYPWLGDEAALAFLQGDGGVARSLILLGVSDRELAQSFLSRSIGRVRIGRYRGNEIKSHGKLATAFLGKFLAIGQARNVRAAIDARLAPASSLARQVPFERARAGLPDRERLLYGYASHDGLRGVLRRQPGLLGRAARLADEPRLEGAAAAVRAEQKGLRLDFASVLTGSRRALRRGRGAPFAANLLHAVPEQAIVYLGMRGADRIFQGIRRVAGGTPLRLPRSLRALRNELSGSAGARLRRSLRPLLEKEAALFVTPSASAPVITLVIDDVVRDEAARLIERLQPLLSRLIERPAEGQVVTFRPTRVAGLDAATLTITPTFQLTYAVFGGRAVVSTSPEGIREVKAARPRITDNPLFDREIRNGLKSATAVLFLDLEQLLALGEQAGLADTPGYRALRADFSEASAIGAVTSTTATGRKAAISIEVP